MEAVFAAPTVLETHGQTLILSRLMLQHVILSPSSFDKAMFTLTKQAIPLSTDRQAGAICTSRSEVIAAVAAELKEHFAWTSAQGLVELQAEMIGAAVAARLEETTPT